MRKIRLPEFDSFEDAYDEKTNTVKSRDYFNGFRAVIDDEHDYIYGYISTTCCYDDAIVATDDIGIKKRSKENIKRIYEKVVKQLNEQYKKWVNSLYIQEQPNEKKGDENGKN